MGAPKYSGADKAAILLMGLGEDLAAEIFKHMSEHEIRRVASAMQRLKEIDPNSFQQVLVEFQQNLKKAPRTQLQDGPEFLRHAIARALPGEKGKALADEMAQGDVRLTAVDLVDAETLAALIAKEHPQTIAIVLAHLDAKKCGETLRHLPVEDKTSLIMRIANLQSISRDYIEELDQHLRQEIAHLGSRGKKKIGGINKVAAILNVIDRTSEQSILAKINELDPSLGEQIRAQMFVFDDLIHLTDRDLQTLIKSVPQEKWLLALRTASDAIKTHVFKNMSERAAKMLQEDMAAMTRAKVTDVEAAQGEILNRAKKLEDEGKISLARNKDDYV